MNPQRRLRSDLLGLVGAVALLLIGPERVLAAAQPTDGKVLVQEALTTSPVTNEWCPVLTDEPVDPDIYMEFRGERVFLCCQKCLKQFRADPTAYVGDVPALALSVDAPGATGSTATGASEEQHDHADHAMSAASRPAGLVQWLGRFHPMVVHFPIALLLMATMAELLLIFTGRSRFAFAARFCLWGGALGALVAAPLGWANALAVAEDYAGFSARLLFFHRWVGVATALAAGSALFACERSRPPDSGSWKGPYRAILFSCALLVIVTGHLGASLIYGWEYLDW